MVNPYTKHVCSVTTLKCAPFHKRILCNVTTMACTFITLRAFCEDPSYRVFLSPFGMVSFFVFNGMHSLV